jgi:hypothetical protein
MSGSIRWFQYTTDGGVNYAVRGDKSNIQAVNPSAAGTPANLPTGAVPSNVKARYALFSDSTGLIKRKVIILTASDLAALTPTTSFTPTGETVAVALTSVRGEKITLPKLIDTGRTN